MSKANLIVEGIRGVGRCNYCLEKVMPLVAPGTVMINEAVGNDFGIDLTTANQALAGCVFAANAGCGGLQLALFELSLAGGNLEDLPAEVLKMVQNFITNGCPNGEIAAQAFGLQKDNQDAQSESL